MREDRFLTIVDMVLIGGLLVVAMGAVSPKIRSWIISKRHDGGAIATAVIQDPKNGKTYKFEIARFVETSDSYCQFETTDGRVIEVVDNGVREK